MLRLLAVALVFGFGSSSSASPLPSFLVGNWTGIVKTRNSLSEKIGNPHPVASKWIKNGSSYVWRQNVLSTENGRKVGSRVLTLLVEGTAVYSTGGQRYRGTWNYNPEKRILDVRARPVDNPDEYASYYVFRFRVSSREVRMYGSLGFWSSEDVGSFEKGFSATERKKR